MAIIGPQVVIGKVITVDTAQTVTLQISQRSQVVNARSNVLNIYPDDHVLVYLDGTNQLPIVIGLSPWRV